MKCVDWFSRGGRQLRELSRNHADEFNAYFLWIRGSVASSSFFNILLDAVEAFENIARGQAQDHWAAVGTGGG